MKQNRIEEKLKAPTFINFIVISKMHPSVTSFRIASPQMTYSFQLKHAIKLKNSNIPNESESNNTNYGKPTIS